VTLFRVASGKTLAVRHGVVWQRAFLAKLCTVGEADPQGGIGDGVDSRTAYVTETEFSGYVVVADGDSACHRIAYTVAWTGSAVAAGGGARTLIVTTMAATAKTKRHANDFSKSLCNGTKSSCIWRSQARRTLPAESRMEFMRSPVPTQMRQDER